MKTAAAVAAGGMAGAAARWTIGAALPHHAFPWATMICNLIGSFALGWWLGRAAAGRSTRRVWHEAVGTGMLGSFTTFSAFSAETVALLREHLFGMAAVYASASIALGWLAAAAGLKLAAVSRRSGS
ncbi:CrcB family protein [Paenibacillus sp. IB182496]|uniref:Fluoride-specific ion channel FluC n=1 Tax=Paenibacillus sabuli TaxID=2772509 RepID=A0A927GT09_9BACL|nr:CrcB family protein [Paenibacillus sabuli]MBD2846227.1 CrcB family protein [Paenibacillus sabuli]